MSAARDEAIARADTAFEAVRDDVLDLSHRLHAHPELGLQEHQAAGWVADAARAVPGARVETGVGGLPTALRAEAGSGGLVVTICAEYDALPDVGHACGHNIIAGAAVGAFAAVAAVIDHCDLTVRLLGTPAEETLGGKITLLDAGEFDGTHLAMMIHPGNEDNAGMRPYACSGFSIEFHGAAAHASAAPDQGVNALDAMTIGLTAVGLARQQLKPGQQIHGAVLSAGSAPNVIPDLARAEYMVRADSVESLADVTAVLRRCMEAGAHATGARLDMHEVGASYLSMRPDPDLEDLYAGHSANLGRVLSRTETLGGSTDMGNVSQRFPSLHPMLSLGAGCPVIHSPAFAAFAGSEAGDRAIVDGARTMARTAIDAAMDPPRRARLLSDRPTVTS